MDKPTNKGDMTAAATVSISCNDINRILELCGKIDRIEVPYQTDPLKMANEAIQLIQGYAARITVLVK